MPYAVFGHRNTVDASQTATTICRTGSWITQDLAETRYFRSDHRFKQGPVPLRTGRSLHQTRQIFRISPLAHRSQYCEITVDYSRVCHQFIPMKGEGVTQRGFLRSSVGVVANICVTAWRCGSPLPRHRYRTRLVATANGLSDIPMGPQVTPSWSWCPVEGEPAWGGDGRLAVWWACVTGRSCSLG
jgi:hypothetical protein